MPQLNLTAKEIHIILQAIRIAMEYDEIQEFARKGEVDQLRNKLQSVKDI